MNNINNLRKELGKVFDDLRDGNLETNTAKEINNTAGKIINSCKVQLEYQHLKGGTPSITYLNGK